MLEISKTEQINTLVVSPVCREDAKAVSPEARLQEAVGLASAIGLHILASEIFNLRKITAATYFSKGLIEKLDDIIKQNNIFLMVIDTSLTPIQQRNLEKTLNIKVIDRTALILEIFGKRAQTNEGKLQVELAHLTYQRSRLVRSWTHLERQRGGAGFLGGPGETQIELDRRIIDTKIIKIKKDLEKVKQTRHIQRNNRKKVPYPIVALVGYTNAGKSSLFNLLTNENVLAADMLFATLDPTLRKIKLPSGKEIILSDTVGFISDLPHELIMAFRSTLEEVLEANIILHIRDISNPNTKEQRKDVLEVLHHLGLKDIEYKSGYIEILNKVDLLQCDEKKSLQQKLSHQKRKSLTTSALTGEGCIRLLNLIDEKLNKDAQTCQITLPASDGKTLSLIYKYAQVLKTKQKDNNLILQIRTNIADLQKIQVLLSPKKT